MDSFELNKILGAILGTLLFVMGVGFLAESIYHPTATGPGYALPEPEGGGEGDNGGGGDTPAVSIGTLLASADATQGAEQAKKCASCHDFTEANANKTGPGLYDVVDRAIASHPGFAYSPALLEHASDAWTYENLNTWLISPKAYAPGTKMTFAGVKNDQERANIIAFLGTLSKSPKPFPPPDAAPAEPSGEPAASSAEPAVSEAPSAEAVETPPGVDTGASEAPGGAMTETPAGGGDVAGSSEAQSAAESAPASSEAAPASSEAAPASSEASSAAQ
jgi:cytochrome c